ncbi:hypothetical protein [Auraticoccus monumenti]|uniref:hypothetical protein n=1 Tax=Auraticoccus monumenti TaxID=675864 RepID=UPI000B882CF4|nr:hypothetical protein [Auraticoccus monumenti]
MVRATAVGVVALLALAGCARPPSSAAEVGDTTISNATVDSTVTGVAQALGAEPGEINRKAVFASLVQGAVVQEVVADQQEAGRDLTVTGPERTAVVQAQPQLQELLTVPEAAPLAEALIDFTVVQQRMGSEAFQEAFFAVPVEVNPRWGTWDPASQEGLTGTGSLSVESYTG